MPEEILCSKEPLASDKGSLAGRRCLVCQSSITADEAACLCPSCRSAFHRECWDEIGGCGSYGCELMAQAPKTTLEHAGSQGWGDEKVCPRCNKTILAAAQKCRYCKTVFPTAAPMSQHEFQEWQREQATLKPTRTAAVMLFLTSLIGFLAPVVLGIGLFWILRSRATLEKAGGRYMILAYFGVGLSFFYTIVLLMVAL